MVFITKMIAESENKEMDDLSYIWFRLKWIYTSVNVITDCDSVETQKAGMSYEID